MTSKCYVARPDPIALPTRAAAEAAYASRNAIANYYRGFLGRFYRQKKTFAEYAKDYKNDWADVIKAAGRPNKGESGKILGAGGLAQVRSAIDSNGSGCN